MRVVLILIIALMLAAPSVAPAGPWLREKGTTFTATSFTINYFRDQLSTTYIEHGLRDDLTIGADIGFVTSRTGVRGGYATAFMRRPLSWGNEANKWAYELGAGAAWSDTFVLPHVKAGLSWGRGINMRDSSGWTVVDASVTVDVNDGAYLAKVDATMGLKFTEVTTGMLQLYLTHLEGETFTAISPSLVFQPKQSRFKLQVGFETPSENFDDTALKIGLWSEF